MKSSDFKRLVSEGIPGELPQPKPYDQNLNHAPKRKDTLDISEKKLAIKNALRYFPKKFHTVLNKVLVSYLPVCNVNSDLGETKKSKPILLQRLLKVFVAPWCNCYSFVSY